MITSVRMVSPIIDTPSRMPDANATTSGDRQHGRQEQRRDCGEAGQKVMPSSSRVWAITETKNVRPRMNSIVSA